MIRALGLICLLSAIWSTGTFAQEGPPPCELTQAEEARREVALERLVQPGDPLAVDIDTTGLAGCGVWELSIAEDGTVTTATLIRGEPAGPYEEFVGGWLRLFRFVARDQPWTSVILIRFTT